MHENFIRCDHKLESGGQCEVRYQTSGGGRRGLGHSHGLPEGWVTVQRHVKITPEEALAAGGMPIDAIMDTAADVAGAEGSPNAEKLEAAAQKMKARFGEMFAMQQPVRCVQAHLCPDHAPKLDVVDSEEAMPGPLLASAYCGY